MTALIDAAIGYARRGLPVFPCASGAKHPLTRRGFKDATSDAPQIREWWFKWPHANIGIRTGNGLAVIDVDPRNGGHETLAAFIANVALGDAPATAEVATGGDGRHLYYRAPAGLAGRVLGPGLDLKSENGYVIAPPSIHSSGKLYVWHPARTLGDAPIADLPEWAPSQNGRVNGPATAPEEWARIVRDGAPPGERNNTAAKLSGRLLAHGLEAHFVLALVETWDQCRNRPPLGVAEVSKTVRSIAAREARKLEGRTP